MRHTQPKMHKTTSEYVGKNKARTHGAILKRVREVCKAHGGCVEIGGGYVAVNTRYYKVKLK